MHRSGQVTTCPENLATMRVPKTHRRKGTRNAYWFRKFYMHPTKGRVSVIFEVKGSKAAADKVAREVTLRCELADFDPYDPYTLLKDQYEGPMIRAEGKEVGTVHIYRRSPTSGPLFSRLADAYLESNGFEKYSLSWQRNIKSALNRHLLPAFGEMRSGAITTETIDDFIVSLLEVGYDPRTPQVCVDVIRYVYAYATKKGLTPEDVAKAVERPQSDGEIAGKAMTLEEARAYLALLGDDPLDRALRASIYTGARPSEYLAFRRRDVNDRTNDWTFRIEVALEPSYSGGKVILKRPKNNRGKRNIHVPQASAELIVGEVDDGFLFSRPDGNPLTVKAVRERHYQVLDELGVETRYRLYDNRHYHNTALLNSPDVAPHTVTRRAGHSDVATTQRVYGHEDTAADRQAGQVFHQLHS